MTSSTIKGGVESGTISGALGHTIHWRKRGSVVELFIVNDTTRIPQGDSDIVTIPTSIRPKIIVGADCYRSYDNKCAYLISPTTGMLKINCQITTGSSSPYYIQGSMVYVL